MSEFVIIFSCFACVGLLLLAEAQRRQRLRAISKTGASLLFIMLAIVCGAQNSLFGSIILIGLIFSAIGDVALLSSRAPMFLVGMGAFTVGHLAYGAAFITTGPEFTGGALAGAAASVAGAALFFVWIAPKLGRFLIPVLVYTIIIVAMTALSFSVGALPDGVAAPWRFAAAAVMFAISDMAVARDRFHREIFFNRVWGLPLYYGAQLLFASSV